MKKFLALAAVLALCSVPAFAADEKKPADAPKAAASCCEPECEMKDGKCAKAAKKECAKDCKHDCCKKAEAPKK